MGAENVGIGAVANNEVMVLEDKISALQSQLRDASLSQAKKYALKKDMAMQKAAKIKLERKLKARAAGAS